MVTEEFAGIAARLAGLAGRDGLPCLVLPYPLEGRPTEEVHAVAVDAYPRLVALLADVA